jgi:PKD repeat protein
MRVSPWRRSAGATLTLLGAVLAGCSPDEPPTAPSVVPNVPTLAPPTSRTRVEGYLTRGELREGFVLDRAGKPMKVRYEVHNGVAIWQGDIELGRASEIATTPERARPFVRPGGTSGTATAKGSINAQATVIIDGDGFRWPGGVMPYVIDGAVPNTGRITDAITMIESTTGGVTIVPRTSQSDYVKFITSDGCSSPIGKQGGEQTIKLADDCSKGNAAHEMMHALGMFHEQSRCDRDDFVEILFDNVEDGKENNFDKECDGATDLGDNYDFGSMMHYSLDAFSKNGQPTIRLRPGVTYDGTIGQRSALSVLDRFVINFLYGLNNIPPVPRIGPLADSYNEGQEVPFDATGSTDADDKVLTYRWNFGDESCFAFPEPADCTQAQPKHVFANDGVYKVGLFVFDAYEEEATEKFVTIKNVKPDISITGLTNGSFFPQDEGEEFRKGGSFDDPGADFWSATVDYGEGGGTQPLDLIAKSFALRHTYADNGSYTIAVAVKDDDETSTRSGTLQVRNVNPKVDAGADQTFTSGQTFNLAGSFSDPGVNDAPWSWSVAWGFGNPTTGSTNTQGAISASRRMCAAGTYNVVLSVTDKDNGTGTDNAQITVGYVVVGLAIMPNANPSSVSLKKQGVLPVAILSSATFDARSVDIASVRLGNEIGTETEVEKLKGKYQVGIQDVNGDGRPDMVLTFSVPRLVANGDLGPSSTSLVIRGFQGSTGDSCINFRGVGAVRVVS